jgi:L-ascorbate metabolism protein UlaG (beta-lactamase superfamily)
MATTVTRVTHSCVLLDFAGQTVLTDPWFTEKPGYYRGERLAYTPGTLPKLAAVVASHDHYDHYDLAAFSAYPDKAVPFVVKHGMGDKARRAGFTNVTEVEPWEQVTAGEVRITAAPARHGVPEITFVIQGAGKTTFFGADTLRIPELDEVSQRFPAMDLALLPVNGLRIRPAIAVPIHYAFTAGPMRDRLILGYDGTADRFERAAAQRAPETTVRVLEPGEPLTLDQ